MNNFLNILAMKESDVHRVVFIKDQEEGGINFVYDPEKDAIGYQVFVHKALPYRQVAEWEFADFSAARNFAAKQFGPDWELLSWDFKTKRPCEEGGRECGSGECDTCKSIKAEGGEASGCAPSDGKGACGCG